MTSMGELSTIGLMYFTESSGFHDLRISEVLMVQRRSSPWTRRSSSRSSTPEGRHQHGGVDGVGL
jgi:hypothetical protein